MNKVLGFLLAAIAVLGLSTAPVLARGGHGGGHHGGGHHGGGHHGGHHSHHSSHSHHHTGHHNHTHSHHGDHHGDHHHYHHSNWAHHNRPFSHGWYGRHGGAWGYGWGGWGWGNPWAVSTFGATAAWLGLEATEPYYGNYGTVDNYLTSDETTESEITADDASEDDANETESTANENEAEENQSAESQGTRSPIAPEQIAAAKQLIAEGKNDPPKDTSFLPLGVFSIAPEGQHEASAMVQLAISKAGQVRGTYYDLLTDHDQPIRGAVDKKTQQVAFTFGENGKVTFETSLANLTQPTGAIAAHFENGQTSTWTLARYAKEPNENEDGEQAPAAEPQSEPAAH